MLCKQSCTLKFIPQHDSVRSYRIYSEEPDPEEEEEPEPELGGDCVERRPKAGIASLGVLQAVGL